MQPNIKLVTISDPREHAWMASRPGFVHENIDMKAIGEMDLSLNSMCMYTFEITSSILFRDFMFSLRPIQPWARSLRSAPLKRENLEQSSELASPGCERFIDDCLEMIDDGLPQDIAREVLPMSLSTVFCITIDHRTVVGFMKTMLEIDPRLFAVYGDLFTKAVPGLKRFMESKVKEFSGAYLITDDERIDGTKTIGEMTFGHYTMKSALAAQFLRQHHSKVKTDLWTKIKESGYHSIALQQRDPVEVVFYADRHAYNRLMQLRSHWFADWSVDMWGSIVGDYIKDMTLDQFWDFIPNGNGKPDPYHRDMYSRVIGEEHNLPCPIMCEWPDLVRQRIQTLGDNDISRVYLGLCNGGFIKDNPDNEYRQEYLKMLEAKNVS